MQIWLCYLYKCVCFIRSIWRSKETQNYGKLASFTKRLFAYLIDYFLLLFVAMFLAEFIINHYYQQGNFVVAIETIMAEQLMSWNEAWDVLRTTMVLGVASISQFVLRPIYYISLEGKTGQTVGKKLLGMRVIDASTQSIVGLRVSNKRYWSTCLSHITLFIGFLSMITNPRYQTLHDRISKTVVISK